MKYILIFMFSHYHPMGIVAEFDSAKACVSAKEVLLEDARQKASVTRAIIAHCFPSRI